MRVKNSLRLFILEAPDGDRTDGPKMACGYFLLLRNKKQLILMAPFLAAARQSQRTAEKMAYGHFLYCTTLKTRSPGKKFESFVETSLIRALLP